MTKTELAKRCSRLEKRLEALKSEYEKKLRVFSGEVSLANASRQDTLEKKLKVLGRELSLANAAKQDALEQYQVIKEREEGWKEKCDGGHKSATLLLRVLEIVVERLD